MAIKGPVVRHLVKLESNEHYNVLIGGKSPTTSMSYIEIERDGDTFSVAAWQEQSLLEASGLQ